MSAKVQRELRRETKRTLGSQLTEFAENQYARLLALEGHVKHEHLIRSYAEQNLARRLDVLEGLTFRERLRWLWSGELPLTTLIGAEEVAASDSQDFWADLGRPADAT